MAVYFETFETGGQKYIIRNMTGTDAGEEIAFTEQASRETDFGTRMPEEYSGAFSLQDEAAALDEMAESESVLYLAAEAPEGGIIASCMCSYVTGKVRMRHLGDISVTVAKNFWGRGIGRRLFEIQMDWARRNKVECLTLMVDTVNIRAVKMYLSLGFVIEGVLRQQKKMEDGTYRDMYVMKKMLVSSKI